MEPPTAAAITLDPVHLVTESRETGFSGDKRPGSQGSHCPSRDLRHGSPGEQAELFSTRWLRGARTGRPVTSKQRDDSSTPHLLSAGWREPEEQESKGQRKSYIEKRVETQERCESRDTSGGG